MLKIITLVFFIHLIVTSRDKKMNDFELRKLIQFVFDSLTRHIQLLFVSVENVSPVTASYSKIQLTPSPVIIRFT